MMVVMIRNWNSEWFANNKSRFFSFCFWWLVSQDRFRFQTHSLKITPKKWTTNKMNIKRKLIIKLLYYFKIPSHLCVCNWINHFSLSASSSLLFFVCLFVNMIKLIGNLFNFSLFDLSLSLFYLHLYGI